MKITLEAIVQTYRNDILAGNIRGIRQRLSSLKDKGMYTAFVIERHGNTNDQSVKNTINVPVYFSLNPNRSLWGNVKFTPNNKFTDSIIKVTQSEIYKVLVVYFCVVTLIQLFLMSMYIKNSGSILTIVKDAYEGNRPRISKMSWLLWEDLIIAVQMHASEFRNLLDRKNKIERRNALNEAIAQTTQAICHDIRKPLSVNRIAIETLHSLKSQEDFEAFKKMAIPEIQKAQSTADNIIKDVLAIGNESPTLEIQKTSVRQLILDALSNVFQMYPGLDIPISHDIPQEFSVEVDRSKISRVLENLIENAVQAVNEKKNLKLFFRVTVDSGSTIISVCNTGSYISKENLPKIFDTFFTLNKKEGTGLGLAIAKKWVLAHGGLISCESKQAKKRSLSTVTFNISLPSTVPPQ